MSEPDKTTVSTGQLDEDPAHFTPDPAEGTDPARDGQPDCGLPDDQREEVPSW